jgi:hypothetical protein
MPRIVKRGLSFGRTGGMGILMGKEKPSPTREERLADKLRENLRRRKQQAREQGGQDKPALPKTPPKS